MKPLILIVAVLCAILLLGGGVIVLVGFFLPLKHKSSRSIMLSRNPAAIYQVLRNFSAAPQWRPDVERVEILPDKDGRVRFREYGKHKTVTYELVEDEPEKQLVTRIVDTDLGYAGLWRYNLRAEGSKTRLQITEDGEVSNLFYRFMSRFVFGHTATIDNYLVALGRRFHETVNPATTGSDD